MKIESEYLNILAHEKGIVTINDMEERETQIFCGKETLLDYL